MTSRAVVADSPVVSVARYAPQVPLHGMGNCSSPNPVTPRPESSRGALLPRAPLEDSGRGVTLTSRLSKVSLHVAPGAR